MINRLINSVNNSFEYCFLELKGSANIFIWYLFVVFQTEMSTIAHPASLGLWTVGPTTQDI